MSIKTYNILVRIISVLLAAFIAVLIVKEAPIYFAFIGVMVAMVLATVIRRSVKEIMTDERSRRIDEKASSLSYRIYTILTALFVLIVISLKNSLPEWAGIAGQTLAYSLCLLMLVHLAVSNFYGKRL